MKTITEYQPLIFTRILGPSTSRGAYPQPRWLNFVVVALYSVAGLCLCFDTGFAPWNWQFWIAFGPLFVAGEIALREVSLMASREEAAETP